MEPSDPGVATQGGTVPADERSRAAPILAPAPERASRVALFRLLDAREWRHFYSAGWVADGELVGELGALGAEPGPATVPVWLTEQGLLVTDGYRPGVEPPSMVQTALWALAPLRWQGFSTLGRRMRAATARARRAVGYSQAGERPLPRPAGAPIAYLDQRGKPGWLPLYSAVHPVTGDQLLTTNRWEANDFGYVEVTLLGFLDPPARASARLGTRRPTLPWAFRFGREIRTDGTVVPEEPGGRLDMLAEVREEAVPPFKVGGWALSRTSVEAVDVLVDGQAIGRARLGIDRMDIGGQSAHPDAPICGFDYILTSSDLPAGAKELALSALVHETGGGEFGIPEVVLSIGEPERPSREIAERAARLRKRGAELLPKHRQPQTEAVNLLAFTHHLGLGGAQLYLLELLRRLCDGSRFGATVVAPSDGPLRDVLEAAGVRVHVTSHYPVDNPEQYEARLAELATWAGGHGFNAVMANTMLAFPGVEVAELLGLPSIFAIHESFDLERFWAEAFPPRAVHPYVKERARETLGRANAVIFEAEATRRQYAHHGEARRFLTFPYGIDLARIDRFRSRFDRDAERRALGLDDSARVVLCLGTVEPRKAQAPLAQAFAAVASSHPDARLVLVGEIEGTPYSEAVRTYAERRGLGDRMEIVPITPEAYKWHTLADVHVCASDVESLPRTILEAMAFEKPVIATRIFGIPDVIEDGRTGYLCEPRDVGDLTRTLDRALVARPEEWRWIGEAASKLVRERHELASYAESFERLLSGLIAGRHGVA